MRDSVFLADDEGLKLLVFSISIAVVGGLSLALEYYHH